MIAPPRIAFRMTLAGQIRMLLSVTGVVLLVGLTLDFATFSGMVIDKIAEHGGPLPLFQYMLYRSTDILLRQMPIIAIISGFLSEYTRTRRGEVVAFASSGLALSPSVAAALIIAMGLGGLQTSLETTLRPAAVWAQVDLGLGNYGRRFAPQTIGPEWIELNGGALRATIERREEVRLTNVLYLPAPREDELIIFEAQEMVPAEPRGTWHATSVDLYFGRNEPVRSFDEGVDVALDLDPLRIRYVNVPGFYLPQDALRQLQEAGPDPDLDTAEARRLWSWAMPGAFFLLGVTLAARVIPVRGLRIIPLLAALFTGYLGTVVLRVFWALAEIGSLPVTLAVTTPLALIWMISFLLLLRGRYRGPVG